MFTALLKVPINSEKDSFFHVRKDGFLVQTLSAKRAIFLYEEKPKGSSYRGQTYAFFLIKNAEIGDSLRRTAAVFANGNNIKPMTPLAVYLSSHYIAVEPPISSNEYSLYQQSAVLEEVCDLLHEQGKPIPKSFDSLLALSLPALFSKVIKADIRQFDGGWLRRRMNTPLDDKETPASWNITFFDSATILIRHSLALRSLGKTITDYVPQETIDKFLLELIREYQFEQYICFAECPYIRVSAKVRQAYSETYNKYVVTLGIAIGLLKKHCMSDNRPSMVGHSYPRYDSTPTMLLYEKDTPCGSAQISVDHNYNVTLSVHNGTGSYPTARFDMTASCPDFGGKICGKYRLGLEEQ